MQASHPKSETTKPAKPRNDNNIARASVGPVGRTLANQPSAPNPNTKASEQTSKTGRFHERSLQARQRVAARMRSRATTHPGKRIRGGVGYREANAVSAGILCESRQKKGRDRVWKPDAMFYGGSRRCLHWPCGFLVRAPFLAARTGGRKSCRFLVKGCPVFQPVRAAAIVWKRRRRFQ